MNNYHLIESDISDNSVNC